MATLEITAPTASETAEERRASFVKSVHTLANLLSSIREPHLALAFTESNDSDSLDTYMLQRQKWKGAFEEISTDLEKQWAEICKRKAELNALSATVKVWVSILNGPEFASATQNLERFVSLFDRLETLRKNGTIETLLSAVR